MRKVLLFTLLAAMLLCISGCGGAKTLHCDQCGKAVQVEADSNMEEDWTLYCNACHETLFGEEGLVKAG